MERVEEPPLAEAAGRTAEAPGLNRKDCGQPPEHQQEIGSNASAAVTGWQQHLPMTSASPDTFLQALRGGYASQMEELTLRNYRMQGLYMGGGAGGYSSSIGGGEFAAPMGMWQNFMGMRSVPQDAMQMNMQLGYGYPYFLPQFAVQSLPAPAFQYTQLTPNYSMAFQNLHGTYTHNLIHTSALPPSLQSSPAPALQHTQLQRSYPVDSENLQGADAHNGICTNAVPTSGFPQSAHKKRSTGKGVAHRPEGARRSTGIVIRNQDNESPNRSLETGNKAPPPRAGVRPGSKDLTGRENIGSDARRDGEHCPEGARRSPGIVIRNQDNERPNRSLETGNEAPPQRAGVRPGRKGLTDGEGTGWDAPRDGVILREWLMQENNKIIKNQRLHIFKQIVEIVHLAHSQGLVLQHLRPSYFRILPTKQVKYTGSLCPKGQMKKLEDIENHDISYLEQHHSEKKRHLEQSSQSGTAPKQQRHGEHCDVGLPCNMLPARANVECDMVGAGDASTSRKGKSVSDQRKQPKLLQPSYGNMSQSPAVATSGYQLSKSEFENLEDRWYLSPEELEEGVYSFSSNIYNLGVLLFELLCYFETWEVHSASMMDLNQRILPPHFLSESLQEANFCLWLLHPEPSSRPKSKDILSCDLICKHCKGRDLISLDQSLANVDEKDAEADLLLHLLLVSKEKKEKQAAMLAADLGFLQTDTEEIEKRHLLRTKVLPNARISSKNTNDVSDCYPYNELPSMGPVPRLPLSNPNEDRLMRYIDPLQKAYFSVRSKLKLSETNTAARSDTEVLKIRDKFSEVKSNADEGKQSTDHIGNLFEDLCKYAQYNRFEVCGRLRNVDILNCTNIICSLSFDRDEEYFAAAAASKKIKIFDFNDLLDDSVDIHYPLTEMSCKSRLTCICWNKYIKNYLASSDSDGVVQLWDASTGQAFIQYTDHQKRAWSVDFSQTDPIKLASGSDDCSVKLWTVNERKCIDTIRNKAHVCCVQFSQHSSNLLAFGSSDSKIHCYDLRYTRIPWCTLSGHRKTVSYVKFVDFETIVSASTDKTLKLWDLNKSDGAGLSMDACTLTFNGHINEKNFIGLSVSNGYIACGSETNEVYAYYKTFPMPITSHKFGLIDQITGQETDDNDDAHFVSSVCWRSMSNTIVAANSTGTIKLLQLV